MHSTYMEVMSIVRAQNVSSRVTRAPEHVTKGSEVRMQRNVIALWRIATEEDSLLADACPLPNFVTSPKLAAQLRA